MSMLSITLGLSDAAMVLVLLVAVLRLRGRVHDLDSGTAVTVAQMQALVQEAQSLSTLLASQLAAQVKLVEHPVQNVRTPAAAERPAGVPVAVAAARGTQTSAATARAALPGGATIEREAARDRGMDPLGLALQRSLHRGAQPAS